MADYFYIKNNSKEGDIAISRRIFEEIALDATNRIIGATIKESKAKNKVLVNLFRPVKVLFRLDGKVEIKVSITINKGLNPSDVCKAIQKEIADSLIAYTESVPFDIHIKVDSIV